MLKESAAISAEAIATTIDQNAASLSPEIAAEFRQLGQVLRKNPQLTEKMIEDYCRVIATDASLQASYQAIRDEIQATANTRSKGPSPVVSPATAMDKGKELSNILRDTSLAIGSASPAPPNLLQRLLRRKPQDS
jgi:hypothetical protein